MHGKSSTTTSISLLLLLLLAPATACTNETAVNYDPSSSIAEDDCHGPASSLAVVVQPPNITAGAPFEPAPVVELRDANGRRVVVHGGGLVVSASYTTIAYSVLTGAAFERTVTVEAAAVDGAANFSGVLATITYASPTLRLGFAPTFPELCALAIAPNHPLGPAGRLSPAPGDQVAIHTAPRDAAYQQSNAEGLGAGERSEHARGREGAEEQQPGQPRLPPPTLVRLVCAQPGVGFANHEGCANQGRIIARGGDGIEFGRGFLGHSIR